MIARAPGEIARTVAGPDGVIGLGRGRVGRCLPSAVLRRSRRLFDVAALENEKIAVMGVLREQPGRLQVTGDHCGLWLRALRLRAKDRSGASYRLGASHAAKLTL